MDIRLQEALDFSNYRLTLSTQLNNLKIKLKSDLLFTYQNAIFSADLSQINYCKTLLDGTVKEFPFEDVNGAPVLIDNLNEFYTEMNKVYQRAMIAYHKEYAAVAKSRNIKKIVEYNG